ncbi:MAG: transglutaminase-like cysteine peptidase [Proteobacteria bacterium]|nr:transglutaminase-like cysteine peptidase [Pseudomonadota bacterium]
MGQGRPLRLLTAGAALAAGLLLFGPRAQAENAGSDEPFAEATVAAADGPLAATWRQLQAELQTDQRIVAQCRVEPAACTSAAARHFIAIGKQGGRDDGLGRLGRINRAVNLALKPVRASGPPSQWTSPLQSLESGIGSCKQYAVVKYAALLDAGIAPDDLRLVIVRIKRPQPPSPTSSHLVVAVRLKRHWYILDNRSLTVSDSRELRGDLEPLFTLDPRGVRQYIPAPGRADCSAPCNASAS